MPLTAIDRLIVNSPYEEPARHWSHDRTTRLFDLEDGRRPAGYVVATPGSQAFDDPGRFVEIPLVNLIRPRVKAWREAGYPGVTGVTKRLLEYWTDAEEFETRRFFFCQLEAAETLIWLEEAPDAGKVGIEIPSDGGAFQRLCAKMATGSGKTVVMAMIVAWHVLNKTAYPQDPRFARRVLVIAPRPHREEPSGGAGAVPSRELLRRRLPHRAAVDARQAAARQGRRPQLARAQLGHGRKNRPQAERGQARRQERRSLGPCRVGGHRPNPQTSSSSTTKRTTPGAFPPEPRSRARPRPTSRRPPSGSAGWTGSIGPEAFSPATTSRPRPSRRRAGRVRKKPCSGWIVSDFGLNDAIESGLVKTPRVVVRDDAAPAAKTYKSRLYHIYNNDDVKDDLNRKAEPQEPLPDLVMNGYHLLGYDWRETLRDWKTPRGKHAAGHDHRRQPHRDGGADQARLRPAEKSTSKSCATRSALCTSTPKRSPKPRPPRSPSPGSAGETARANSPRNSRPSCCGGRSTPWAGRGKEGERIQNVISVGMLSEGWDAKTVTHIMGLRAFTSQLLCEQVVGRGLRRTSYEVNADGLFEPEYVNIFGVPFTFLPHEGGEGAPPAPPKPKTAIEPAPDKAGFALSWPNVIRIDRTLRPRLSLDWEKTAPLELDAAQTAQLAELAPIVEGKPDITKIESIDLEKLAREFRIQRIAFETARDVYDQMEAGLAGRPGGAAGATGAAGRGVRPVGQNPHRPRTVPSGRPQAPSRHHAQHDETGAAHLGRPSASRTPKPWSPCSTGTGRSAPPATCAPGTPASLANIRGAAISTSASSTAHGRVRTAFALDHADEVAAWVKNDHLGFEVFYVHRGVVRKYRPDFLVRLKSGDMLVLETKGQDSDRDRTKRRFLREWIEAVNAHGGFGRWSQERVETSRRHPGHSRPAFERRRRLKSASAHTAGLHFDTHP